MKISKWKIPPANKFHFNKSNGNSSLIRTITKNKNTMNGVNSRMTLKRGQ